MDKEFAQLVSILEGAKELVKGGFSFTVGRMGNKEIVLQKCGIGKVNSAVGAVELIREFSPDVVVSSGCAGGANADLNVLDVVVAEACVYHDAYCGKEQAFGQVMGMPVRYESPVQLVEKALSLNGENRAMRIRAGLTVSGDWFVDSREKMQTILSAFPDAMAVDMESCSIAQVCYIYKVAFVSFRVISDVPLKDVGASQYYDFWERVANGSFEITKDFLLTL